MPTEIYYKVKFNVNIHGTVGITGSEVVVGIGVQVSQSFINANVKTCALRGTRGISQEYPCGHPHHYINRTMCIERHPWDISGIPLWAPSQGYS